MPLIGVDVPLEPFDLDAAVAETEAEEARAALGKPGAPASAARPGEDPDAAFARLASAEGGVTYDALRELVESGVGGSHGGDGEGALAASREAEAALEAEVAALRAANEAFAPGSHPGSDGRYGWEWDASDTYRVLKTDLKVPQAGWKTFEVGEQPGCKGRELLDVGRARELLHPLLHGVPEEGGSFNGMYGRVGFKGVSFGVDEARVINSVFAKHTSLREVDLSDILSGRGDQVATEVLAVLAEGLRHLDEVWELDISDNALGERGVRTLGPALSASRAMRRLIFRNDGMSSQACEALAEILLQGREGAPTHLTQIASLNNMSGDDGAKALGRLFAASPKLEDLQFSSCRVSTDGCVAICEGLLSGRGPQGGALRRLDLSGNMYMPEGGEALGRMLREQRGLECLNLADTGLTDEGVASVLEGLRASSAPVRELDLSLNEVTGEAVEDVAAYVCAIAATLEALVLNENEFEDEGGKQLCDALLAHPAGFPRLKKLSLVTNMLGAPACVSACAVAMRTPTLEQLLLDDNQIPEAAVAKIRGALEGAGRAGVLGPLDENDPDGGGDDDGGADDLESLMSGLNL